jgi:hypothetical protein
MSEKTKAIIAVGATPKGVVVLCRQRCADPETKAAYRDMKRLTLDQMYELMDETVKVRTPD